MELGSEKRSTTREGGLGVGEGRTGDDKGEAGCGIMRRGEGEPRVGSSMGKNAYRDRIASG